MAWTLDGIRIFVNESKEDAGQVVPRLQTLGGGTTLQTFGYESDIRTLGCVVVGIDDKEALKDLRKSGSSYTLNSPYGDLGSFIVKNVQVVQIHCICQTLRPDLDPDAPVFSVELQLYE